MARIESRYHYPEVGQVLSGSLYSCTFLFVFHRSYSSYFSLPSFLTGDHIVIFLKVEEFPGVGEVGEDEEEVKEESTDFTFAKVCLVVTLIHHAIFNQAKNPGNVTKMQKKLCPWHFL